MRVRLVPATAEDAPRLLEIQKACFAPHLARYGDVESSPATASLAHILGLIGNDFFYKILAGEAWVGSINIRRLGGDGRYKLHMINILPEHQGRGIGQAAIALAERKFPDARRWYLETLADMAGNRHVYEKLGYAFTGQTEKINEKLTLVFYEKAV